MNKKSRPENNGYIGIRDTIKLAEVFTVTVSRVINNLEMTPEKVRKKVQKVIEEYNYVPNQPIKKIFSKTSDTIVVFIYDVKSPFFISLIKGLSQVRLEHNYMFLICGTGSNPELEKKYLRSCLTDRCTDIIPAEGADSNIFEACRIHISIAFLDYRTYGKFSGVRFNNRQMMQPVVDYLYNLRCRKIAFVDCKIPMDSVISRQNGYIETMAGRGLPIIQEYIYDRNLQLTPQAGNQALSYFLSLPTASTTIICCNDTIALGALNAAYSLGLKIPADTSIVESDSVISNPHQPQITIVQQSLRNVSLELFELVANPPEEPVSKIIEASFIRGVICSRIETPQK